LGLNEIYSPGTINIHATQTDKVANISQGVLNHEELLVKFSQAIADIGDALSLTKLRAHLFQTDAMKDAIGRLYSYILLFFQGALQWYTTHPLKRAVRSITKPYDLEYKQIAEQIRTCAQGVGDIADVANHAEMRDMHLTVHSMQKAIEDQAQKLLDIQTEIQSSHQRMDTSIDHLLKIAHGRNQLRLSSIRIIR
jgi:hypothetical protein